MHFSRESSVGRCDDYEAQLARVRRLRSAHEREYRALQRLPAPRAAGYRREREDRAATRIQAAWRGHRVRKACRGPGSDLGLSLARDRGARTIQNFFRERVADRGVGAGCGGVSIRETPATPTPPARFFLAEVSEVDEEEEEEEKIEEMNLGDAESYRRTLDFVLTRIAAMPVGSSSLAGGDDRNSVSVDGLVDRFVEFSLSRHRRVDGARKLNRLLRDLAATTETVAKEMRLMDTADGGGGSPRSPDSVKRSVRWLRSGSKVADNVAKMRHEAAVVRAGRRFSLRKREASAEPFDFLSDSDDEDDGVLEKLVALDNL